jgi:hypothetical protein
VIPKEPLHDLEDGHDCERGAGDNEPGFERECGRPERVLEERYVDNEPRRTSSQATPTFSHRFANGPVLAER